MQVRQFDLKLVEEINSLIRKNPDCNALDWFTVGFLCGRSTENKSVQDHFNDVNNVSKLAKAGQLDADDTNEILIKMMNNMINKQVKFSLQSLNLNRQEIMVRTRSEAPILRPTQLQLSMIRLMTTCLINLIELLTWVRSPALQERR